MAKKNKVEELMAQAREKMGEKPKVKKEKKKSKTVQEKYEEIKESFKPVVKLNSDEELLISELFNVPVQPLNSELPQEAPTHREINGLWDFVLEDKIDFFDPECSYELTKYKPITETKGLDFDPNWFTEAAQTYDSTGKYTEYPQGSKPYADYWNEQYRRCREGYEVNGYRITGDHYFFINFYRMQTIVEGRVAGKGRNESFPSFFAKQYEFFHYVEMAEILHKDIALLKARGLGLSECVASLLVRPYTTNRGYKCLLTAPDEAKLKNTRKKC